MKSLTVLLAVLALLLGAPAALASDTCDYNTDGTCDNADRDIIMGAQGAQEGDADFVPAADHDGDGVISLADVAVFLQLSGS